MLPTILGFLIIIILMVLIMKEKAVAPRMPDKEKSCVFWPGGPVIARAACCANDKTALKKVLACCPGPAKTGRPAYTR